jgi:hypothetical protein
MVICQSGTEEAMSSSRFLLPFRRLLKRHPLLTNCVSYGLLCGAAEATQQAVEMKWVKQGDKVKDSINLYACCSRGVYFIYKW